MSRKQFVQPRDGLVVRNPLTMEPLPASGVEVEMTPYWRRRLRDGDIVKVNRAKASVNASAHKEA